MNGRGRKLFTIATALAAAGALGACGTSGGADEAGSASEEQAGQAERGRFGIDIPFFGGEGGRSSEDVSQAGIGVNAFLWRASLDTINFMPLASADPFGGVIISDWYTDPSRPNERFKATIYILDTRLRADAVNVSVFRQELTSQGWQDVQVSAGTNLQIENAILTKARQLRLSTLREDD